MVAAGDEETDERTLDGELGREQPTLRFVGAGPGIGETAAGEAAEFLDGVGRAARGRLAEGFALDGPVAVVVALEVGEDDGRPLGRLFCGSGGVLQVANAIAIDGSTLA